jgi:hypothetical protein
LRGSQSLLEWSPKIWWKWLAVTNALARGGKMKKDGDGQGGEIEETIRDFEEEREQRERLIERGNWNE